MSIFSRKRKGPKNVAILGSGPAALFAAQAVYDTGNVVQIFSRGERSPLFGAQYLHAPVPGLDCGNPATVDYILKGSVGAYRRKVYGTDDPEVRVSPEVLPSQHLAWDIRSAYGQAWDRFSGLIRRTEITAEWLRGSAYWLERADLVVWTLPLQPFCLGGHYFKSQTVWAQGDAPELGQYCSVKVEPWTVVVNGEDSPRWYRASNVFGHLTAEWPLDPKPPITGLAKVDKPIESNCTCWGEMTTPIIRVGRYGTWRKSELSHMAYVKTRSFLEA